MTRKGFTLVETLVALAILAVGLLALAKLNLTYVQANTFSNQTSAAAVYAKEKMEELRRYAISDRTDNFGVYDFDYLTSTDTAFAYVEDPPGSGTTVQVDGLLSGSSGGVARTTGGNQYDVLTLAAAASPRGNPVYEGSDTVYTATGTGAGSGFSVDRHWTVEPIPNVIAGRAPDYAVVTVTTSWTDRFSATPHTTHLESVVHRRQ